MPVGQRIPGCIVGSRRGNVRIGRGKQPGPNPGARQGIVRLVGDGIGLVSGEQVKDDDGQAEEVMVPGAVGIVALRFRGLELGTPYLVGEGASGGGVGEPVRVAVHHGDVVLPVDLDVLFVHVADDVTGFVNGAETQGQVARHAHPVVNPYLAGLRRPGALGCPPIVVLNNRLPGFGGVEDGHGVANENPVLYDHVLRPGDLPGFP